MRRAYAIGMALLVAVAFVGSLWFSVRYTRQVDQRSAERQAQARRESEERQAQARREAERRWCPLLATLDQPGVPATTERGRVVQTQIHQLRVSTGCEEK